MAGSRGGANALPGSLAVEFLERSRVVVWARLSEDGRVITANSEMARRFGVERDQLEGSAIVDLVTEDEKPRMIAWLNASDPRPRDFEPEKRPGGEGGPPMPSPVNFVSANLAVFTLRCQLFMDGDDRILIGEPDIEEDRSIADELLRLNSEFSVLSRENARRSRELEAARRELAETLAELEASHWHLRKIRENLPLCMECGRMNTGEAQWESIVEYLRSNDILVSHGYCPSCAEKLLNEDGSA
ncbi:MAG: PAS domain-containing protein [Gemmatimonadales bacterium]|nr:MAG: PAS domain-containing protein [Gemmatimonadales bacterium]